MTKFEKGDARAKSGRARMMAIAAETKAPLAFAGPPPRRRIVGRNLGWPQRDKVATLVGIATNLRAILAAHIAL
jgi:hypothetical protein